MDGCPHELWKVLEKRNRTTKEADKPSFNLAKTMAKVFNNIQKNGVDK
jgi:hypothetical protein